jgi:hypothetical protein
MTITSRLGSNVNRAERKKRPSSIESSTIKTCLDAMTPHRPFHHDAAAMLSTFLETERRPKLTRTPAALMWTSYGSKKISISC